MYPMLYPLQTNLTNHIAIVSSIEMLIYFWPFYLMGKNLEGVVDHDMKSTLNFHRKTQNRFRNKTIFLSIFFYESFLQVTLSAFKFLTILIFMEKIRVG